MTGTPGSPPNQPIAHVRIIIDGKNSGNMTDTPIMLNDMCAYAARLAFFERLSDAIHDVMVVPRSAPSEKATAVCHSRTPAAPRPMTMPVVAEEEWIIAVMSAAIRTQEIRLMKLSALRVARMDITSGMLRRGRRPP